ncbi:MAG TPA: hypothetical protein VF263_18955 [Longimicrobiaceae bacterium]
MTKRITRLKLGKDTLRRLEQPMRAMGADAATPTEFCTFFCATQIRQCFNTTTADCTN